jgi:hypothetical protein
MASINYYITPFLGDISADGDVSDCTVLPGGATAARTLAARFGEVVNVLDWAGFDPTGAHDNTTIIQAAANAVPTSGGVLLLPMGTVAMKLVSLNSNTTVRGQGRGTIVVPALPWPNGTVNSDASSWNCFFQNANFAASVLTDTNIIIEDIVFNYGSYINSNAHCIQFRMASSIVVRNCMMNGGANATAMVACDNTLIVGCTSTNAQNACFDHWEGCTNVRVIGNHAVMPAGYGTAGIQVSGVGTEGQVCTSSGIAVCGNTVIASTGNGPAIVFNSLAPGSAVNDGTISGNIVKNGMILLDGSGSNHVVTGNVIDGPNAALWLRSGAGGIITGCQVNGNTVANAVVIGGNISPVHVDGTNNAVSNTTVTGGIRNVGIWLASTSGNCSVLNSIIDTVPNTSSGSSVPYQNSGPSSNTIVDANGGTLTLVNTGISLGSVGGFVADATNNAIHATGNVEVPALLVTGGSSPIGVSAGPGVPTGAVYRANVSATLRLRSDGAPNNQLYIAKGDGTFSSLIGGAGISADGSGNLTVPTITIGAFSVDTTGNPTTPSMQIAGGASPIWWTAGPGAPTNTVNGAHVRGSKRTRTDGAVGSTEYVSQGDGTWLAIPGV